MQDKAKMHKSSVVVRLGWIEVGYATVVECCACVGQAAEGRRGTALHFKGTAVTIKRHLCMATPPLVLRPQSPKTI